MRNNNPKKLVTTLLLGIVIIAGGYYAYNQGLLPGIGGSAKTAAQLKQNIEALKGNNIEAKAIKFITNSSIISKLPQAEQAQIQADLEKSLKEDIDLSFYYKSISTSSKGDKGIVKIIEPKLNIADVKGNSDFDIKVPLIIIAQTANNEGHYYFSTEGDVEIWFDSLGTGNKTKLFAISYENNNNELRFAEGLTEYSKYEGKNFKLIEGKGNTTLFSVGNIFSESSTTKSPDNKINMQVKSEYSNISPGDMLKLVLGNIEPINFKINYSYTGDDLLPNKKISGEAKIDNISLKTGEAGISTKGNLTFNEQNTKQAPVGELVVTINSYKKLIKIISSYYPISSTDIQNIHDFIINTAVINQNDAVYNLKFDGTENIKVNNKTTQEFDYILEKHLLKNKSKTL